MPKKQETDVDENSVQDEETELQDHENADTEETEDTVEHDEALDEEVEVTAPSEDEIEPELLALAQSIGGMSESQARSRGRRSLLAYLEAKAGLERDRVKEPEEDPFMLKLDPEVVAELPEPLVKELGRIAKAAKDGIKSARDEVGSIKDKLVSMSAFIEQKRVESAFENFMKWCDKYDPETLGTDDEPNKKAREKLFKEAVRLSNKSPELSIPDACSIAYNNVFKGKRNQQARRKLAEAAKKHSDSAVGRGSTVRQPEKTNGTRQASIESVRALFRSYGVV